jgi:hypothetical protein
MQREYQPGTFRQKLFGGSQYLPDRHIGRSYRRLHVRPANNEMPNSEKVFQAQRDRRDSDA